MSKCAAYWRAKDAGKNCGVPKPGKQSRIAQDLYQYGIVPDLVSMGIKEDDVYELLTYTTCNHSTKDFPRILSLKRDSPIRKKILELIFGLLASGKMVKYFDLDNFVRDNPEISRREWTRDDYIRHYGIFPKHLFTTEHFLFPSIDDRCHKKINRFPCQPKISRTQEQGKLCNLCTSGQLQILHTMNSSGYGDDEYAAFCIALKWAAERLEQEKSHD